MYYFLNTKIAINKSGIEHAQIKRMNLFNEHGVANKIVTRSLVLNATDILKASRIPVSNYLNMYDFFRGETIPDKTYNIDDFEIPTSMVMHKKNNEYLLDYQGKTIQILMTKSDDDRRVDNIRLVSKDGKLVKTSWYDTRGFIGVEEYFDKNNELSVKEVLAPSGKVTCQIFYMSDKQGKVKPSFYQLPNYQGHDLQFNSEEDLMTFFLDELAKKDKNVVYIGDRATEYAYSLFSMHERAFKILVLHSSHVADNDNPLKSELNNNFYYSLNHLNCWQTILTSTKQQLIDFNNRYHLESKTHTIPVGNIERTEKVLFENRRPYSIGLIARLAPEKQQLQAVKAIEKVKSVIPQVKLHFYGYSNGDYGQKVKKVINEKHLDKTIIFENYTDSINDVYKTIQLQLLTSSVEGFAMSVLEGLSNGVPQISYDIKYGPKDIITDGEDGYLVKPDDIDELAEKIINYFNDLNQAKKMSENAYQNSRRYSKNSVYNDWKPLFNQVEKFYKKSSQEVLQ